MTAARMLSKVSELYDVDGDGKLNETEQAMRDMDEEGKGHIDNRKVYKIMEQQIALQKQLFNMKRILIALVAFALILALSNLGTAFAAARLAKDTSVSQPQAEAVDGGVSPTLQDKAGNDLATLSKGITMTASSFKVDESTSGSSLRSRQMKKEQQSSGSTFQRCPMGRSYQPLMGCYLQPRVVGNPCSLNNGNGQATCDSGLTCAATTKYARVSPITGECISITRSYNGYNVIVVPSDSTKGTATGTTSGSEVAGASSIGSNSPVVAETPQQEATAGADEPVVSGVDDELAVPGADVTSTTPVINTVTPVSGVATTDDSVANYVTPLQAQLAWGACLTSTPATIEHACYDSLAISQLGCRDTSRTPTRTGNVYYFENNVIIDCSLTGETMCRATGLRCSDVTSRTPGNGNQPAAKPATKAPTPSPPACPQTRTQENMGLNNPQPENICAMSCECKSDCCIQRAWPQQSVCMASAPNPSVSCMEN